MQKDLKISPRMVGREDLLVREKERTGRSNAEETERKRTERKQREKGQTESRRSEDFSRGCGGEKGRERERERFFS